MNFADFKRYFLGGDPKDPKAKEAEGMASYLMERFPVDKGHIDEVPSKQEPRMSKSVLTLKAGLLESTKGQHA